MSKYSESPRSEEVAREEAASDLGKSPRKGDIRSNAAQAKEPQGTHEQICTGAGVNMHRQRQRREKAFSKIFTLGAQRMTGSKLFNRATRVFMALVRDSSYGGRCYTNSTLLADELGLTSSDVRKIIRALEDEQMLMRIDAPNSPYYLLNPYYVMAGDEQSEEIARAIWARERTKKVEAASAEAASKARKPATSRS